MALVDSWASVQAQAQIRERAGFATKTSKSSIALLYVFEYTKTLKLATSTTCFAQKPVLEDADTTAFVLLFDKDLEILVDDRDGEEDTSTRADGAHHVGHHRQGPDAQTAKRSSGWDVEVEDLAHVRFTVSLHHHLLFLELLGDFLGGCSGNVNPHGGKPRARGEHENNVDNRVDGVREHVLHAERRRHVVHETADRDGATAVGFEALPRPEEADDEVAAKLVVEHLGNEVEVGHQCALQDNRNVGRVEELDRVRANLTSDHAIFDWDIDTEALRSHNDTHIHHYTFMLGRRDQDASAAYLAL